MNPSTDLVTARKLAAERRVERLLSGFPARLRKRYEHVSREECAALIHKTVKFVDRLRRDGRLRSVTVDRRCVLIPLADVEALLYPSTQNTVENPK